MNFDKKQLRNTMLLLAGGADLGHSLCGAKCGQRLCGAVYLFGGPQLAGLRIFDRAGFAAPRQGPQSGSRCSVLDQRPDAAAGRCVLRHCAVCGFGGTADRHWHHQHGQGGLFDGAVCGAGTAAGGVLWAAAGGQTGNLRLHQLAGLYLLCLAGTTP